jgi:uncharacterized protein
MGGVLQLLLVGLVMALGLAGVLIPGVPGRWLVWAAMLWWSLHDQSGLAWVLLVASTALLLVVQVVLWLMPPRRVREAGTTRRVAVWAGLGSVLGFFLLPVVGAVPGFLAGIYFCERRRLGGHGQAKSATRAVMRSGGTSELVEFFSCLLIAGAWLGAVVLG